MLKKPEKPGRAGDGQRGSQHRGVGPGDALAQAAHVAHVLFAAHGVHHAAGAEEEQRLEKGVGHQVKDARAERAHAAAQEHVAELADGGIGQNLLDVGLHQGDGGGETMR